jgi:hypothetical protein
MNVGVESRAHAHTFELWATFHRAPIGPPPAHTAFVVLTCMGCGTFRIFPPQNFALVTEEFKAAFRAAAAAAGWREETGESIT